MYQQGENSFLTGLKISVKNILISELVDLFQNVIRGPNIRILTNHISESV